MNTTRTDWVAPLITFTIDDSAGSGRSKNRPAGLVRARVDNRARGPYIESMSRGRIIVALLAATVFLLRAGDCMTYLFADQQTQDCCKRGNCSPSRNADPCCQTSKVTSAQHFQAQEKISVPVLTQAEFLGPVPLDLAASCRFSTLLPCEDSTDSPPGSLARTSLPLLI